MKNGERRKGKNVSGVVPLNKRERKDRGKQDSI